MLQTSRMTGKSPADKNTNFNNFFLIKKVVLRYFVVTCASCNKGGNLQQLPNANCKAICSWALLQMLYGFF